MSGSGSLGSGSLGSGSLGSGSLGSGSLITSTGDSDSVCTTAIMANIRNFSTWKSTVSSNLNSITSSSTPTPTQEAALNTASADIFQTVACLNEILSGISGLTNNIQTAQEDVLSLNRQISEAEEHVSIARDRVGYIRNPEKHTSFYESWFPLGRPMQPTSIPVFVAVNTFLFIAGIFLLLTFFGFKMSFPISTGTGMSTTRFSLSDSLLLLLVGFIIYYFLLRK